MSVSVVGGALVVVAATAAADAGSEGAGVEEVPVEDGFEFEEWEAFVVVVGFKRGALETGGGVRVLGGGLERRGERDRER